MEKLEDLRERVAGKNAQEIISLVLGEFADSRILLASSFSIEDQVLTHMLVSANPQTRIVTLDTGRHFQETYDVWQRSVDTWHLTYEVCSPDPTEIARLVTDKGPNLFYESIEARKACCAVRKTHPLGKVLSTVDAWIVGLRSGQAVTRENLSPIEYDEAHGIYRVSPLYNWTEAKVYDYVRANKVPISVLHERGFRSIGCAPCTRAIGPHDDIRAGRWWWENPEHKECGLHSRPKH